MNARLFLLILSVVGTALFLSLWAAYLYLQRTAKKRLTERLGVVTDFAVAEADTVFVLKEDRGTAMHIRLQTWAMAQVEAAGLKWSGSKVIAMCIACAVAGALVGLRLGLMLPRSASAFSSVPAIAFVFLPFLYLARLRRKRLNLIESQLPDALDFLARSLRVGNSFLMALETLVQESEEPIRSEFQRVTNEIRLGSTFAEPLHKLVQRVPLIDLRMFVSAVLLQRETGGNLGALLTRIAGSIRDRFRVRGQVTAAASQAELSARIISAMPFVVLGGILLLSPGYLKIMTDEALGRKLLVGAAVGQVAGFLIMRKIVRIKV